MLCCLRIQTKRVGPHGAARGPHEDHTGTTRGPHGGQTGAACRTARGPHEDHTGASRGPNRGRTGASRNYTGKLCKWKLSLTVRPVFIWTPRSRGNPQWRDEQDDNRSLVKYLVGERGAAIDSKTAADDNRSFILSR